MILSFIVFYAGQFLFFRDETTSDEANRSAGTTTETTAASTPARPFPVEYRHTSSTIGSYKQEIFTLEFDPLDERIEFKPVLSYDSVFGFEKLSEICRRKGAYAAVNGGFFYEYGDPVGMVSTDGELFMAASGYDPVFIVDGSGARFEKIIPDMSFSTAGGKVRIDLMNRTGKDGELVLYTDAYGSTNRAKLKNTSVRIENGTVTAIFRDTTEVPLKKNSHLISFYGKKSSLPDSLGIKAGDAVNIDIKPEYAGKYQAYECGSMLVKDGKNIAPDRDRWVGTLLNHDPRTAIGIKEDGRVVLLVVDGRQPGYSTGFTGPELADYLIGLGVRDAAMLDGGATSQIFVEGKLRNKPSYESMERPVAGAFIVKIKNSEN